ncbi:MAG: DUF2079 domain-containing protein [Elusimicrobiota bacterium]|jgi:uncharacterized membrane protein
MDWTRLVPLTLEWLWALAGGACLLAAAALALRPALLPDEESARRIRGTTTLALGLVLPALLAAFKLAQFRRFELMWDSGVLANLVYTFAHGGGWHTSVIADQPYLAVHFAFTAGLLAPLVRLWPSTAVLAAAHGLAVGLSAFAAWRLGRRLAGEVPGLLLVLLLCAHPFFHDVAGSVLDNSIYVLPFFLFGALAWEAGRPGWAAVCALGLLSAREQMPLLFVGTGVLVVLRARDRRGRLLGAALAAAALALLFAELELIRRARIGWDAMKHWEFYAELGGSPSGLLRTALRRPWAFPLALLWPPEKPVRLLRGLLELGFLPAFSGAALVPALVLWLPQGLAGSGTMYNQLIGHNAVYVFGPLVWAGAHGLRRLWERFPERRAWLAAGLLLVAGTGFLQGGRFLLPEGMNPAHWRENGPKALAFIPPGASVWTDEFFLPHLGMRRRVKSFLRNADPYFERGLFVPDRVLLSTHWIALADSGRRDAVLKVLRERRFVELYRERDLVVLADPATLGKEGGEPEPLVLGAEVSGQKP